MSALHDDLLGVAQVLFDSAIELESELEQAAFRRTVSTAYYALFHLLIHEATRNWTIAEQRSALGRTFEHGAMKAACARKIGEVNGLLKTNPPPGKRETVEDLRAIAETFVSMHQYRESADYDTAMAWTETEVAERLDSVIEAFKKWERVRETREAQDLLLSLFVKPRK